MAVRATVPRAAPVVAPQLLGGPVSGCVRRIRGGGRLLSAVMVAATLLTGCTVPDAPRPAPHLTIVAPPGPDDVDCSDAIDQLAEPPADLQVILGAVALPTRMVLQPQSADEPGWLFAKYGLLVRADTAVELEIAGDVASHARIGWGSPGPQGRTVRVPVCHSPGWLAFAGGYTVDAARCLPLTIRVGGYVARAAIAVGRACGSATNAQ